MFFKKQPSASPASAGNPGVNVPQAEWELGAMIKHLKLLAPVLETKAIEPALVQAQLADHYRDYELEPLPPVHFDRLVLGLDVESWRRLALAIGALDQPQ